MHNGLGLLVPVSNKHRQASEGMATGQLRLSFQLILDCGTETFKINLYSIPHHQDRGG